MTLREKIKAEIAKVSEMDNHKKWEYYKSYYMGPSIVAVLILAMLAWYIKDTFYRPDEVSIGCAFSVELTDEQREYLTDGYIEYYGYNPKKSLAYLSMDNLFADTAQKVDADNSLMALYAQIASGQIYYLILDEKGMNTMVEAGIYADLDDIFDKNYLSNYETAIVELSDSDVGKYRGAIDLTKIGFLPDDKEGYLVFTIARPDDDYPKRLLDFISNYTGVK